MISVEFRSITAGTCGWCRKQKDEVYNVAFSDKSFVGPMCKGALPPRHRHEVWRHARAEAGCRCGGRQRAGAGEVAVPQGCDSPHGGGSFDFIHALFWA